MKNKVINILVLIFVGVLNGLFSTGAGQILLFYYIYYLKQDTKEAREKCLSIMPIISIPTLIFYVRKSKVEITKMFILVVLALICGFIGNKLMNKMNEKVLNILSGIFLVVFSLVSLWRMFV